VQINLQTGSAHAVLPAVGDFPSFCDFRDLGVVERRIVAEQLTTCVGLTDRDSFNF
jgi:hypothetical protein